ncbi:hypothetical protein N658DRAFT_566361 [Parathielavia hyrcaniae]|uniref:Uncharacterized protein n=1 Tax=Parathielavia hyrcaniae TaxID=113614 RepID=A0AAN6Q799_9PEZI|nr:hypothetical protein N658DRAFT_566361 [Parathielavia hyrcaniae]
MWPFLAAIGLRREGPRDGVGPLIGTTLLGSRARRGRHAIGAAGPCFVIYVLPTQSSPSISSSPVSGPASSLCCEGWSWAFRGSNGAVLLPRAWPRKPSLLTCSEKTQSPPSSTPTYPSFFPSVTSAGALGDLAAGSQEASSPRIPSEPHENPTTPAQQRQRRTLPRRQDTVTPKQEDRLPTPSSQRTLRRTPRFTATPSPRPSETPRRVHLEAATVGISPRPLFSTAPGQLGPAEQVFHSFRRQLSEELSDDEEESAVLPQPVSPDQTDPHPTKPHPHPAVRLSKHNKSAILWALEEALRQPHPFSPDLIEENASMADLLGGGTAPATSNGHAASSSRPTAPPAQTGSPQQVIRGPRMIMRERAEREARQRAEREQMERARAEEEARLLEEAQRRAAEQRPPVAGAVSGGDFPTDPATQRRQQRAQEAQSSSRNPAGMPSAATQQQSAAVPPLRPTRVPASAQPGQTAAPAPQPGANPSAPPQANESSGQGTAASRIKNSFPHAFERWEALSAHWEGMTSFWLRRLQENTDEAERNPISTQLSRQVADLSAAGANLFHAVVELQRLRASSERKFQRWFFETRAELERHQEVNAMLEAQMEQERQARAEAVRNQAQHDAENLRLQKLVTEMRRELLISKEEARRAWEELGRREQEERDRTVSLQQGHPTLVGGVQVVPMTQTMPGRTAARHGRSHSHAVDTSEYAAAAQGSQYPAYATAPAAPAAPPTPTSAGDPGARYYQQPEGAGPDAGAEYGAGSEAGYSEGEYMMDARGNYLRDENGNRIPFHSPAASPSRGRRSDAGAEEYETPVSQAPTNYPPSSSHWAGEYSGQGFAAPGWETMPRHHHPTRLSDVIEEDERSRTSVSQVSRA